MDVVRLVEALLAEISFPAGMRHLLVWLLDSLEHFLVLSWRQRVPEVAGCTLDKISGIHRVDRLAVYLDSLGDTPK
jgi:hypothetical protein